jgi:HTH-type transcriptional regulator/antitoxin HipB
LDGLQGITVRTNNVSGAAFNINYIRTDIIVDYYLLCAAIYPFGKVNVGGEIEMAVEHGTDGRYGKVDTSEAVGQVIRTKRKETGIKQEIAAGMCGVGTKFMSQLENGKETAELGKTLQVLRKMGLEVYIYPRSANPFKDR